MRIVTLSPCLSVRLFDMRMGGLFGVRPSLLIMDEIKMEKIVCIYHGNCADGFAAAWVFRKAVAQGFFGKELNVEIEYYPSFYQTPPPNVVGKSVVMLDFSYKRDVIDYMLGVANGVLIIDHHKTAIADLSGIKNPKFEEYFDINRCGAMLTWNYYFPNTEPPQLLKHIQDRDLWQFKFRDTRPIQANLFSFPYDFSIWDGLMKLDTEGLRSFAIEGEALERKHFKDIKEFSIVSTRMMKIGNILMPVVNVPYMWGSDAAHILAEDHDSQVAAYYWDGPLGRTFGLRSIDSGPDCGEIAKLYGGGGHRNAAGFKCSPELAKTLEVGSVWDNLFIPF